MYVYVCICSVINPLEDITTAHHRCEISEIFLSINYLINYKAQI